MKRFVLSVLLAFLAPFLCLSQSKDSLKIMFWNVENFFDWQSDSTRNWTRQRFYTKCNAVAKTILLTAEKEGGIPCAVGFAEIGNRFVLKQLIESTPLRKMDWQIVHFESHDKRGIDCGLIYRKSVLKLLNSKPIHILDKTGNPVRTRDILCSVFQTSSGDSLAILVNHHPSQLGGKTELRDLVFRKMEDSCDSLMIEGCRNVLCIGDFNEDRWHNGGKGTIKYNGGWEKIDGYFAYGDIEVKELVCDYDILSTKDNAFGGSKPLRTWSGPRYLGGTSDHYPVALTVYFP